MFNSRSSTTNTFDYLTNHKGQARQQHASSQLYEMFELERQEDDDEIQRLINKQLKEKLVVSTSNRLPITML
jgi:hypothetical protein